jgi:predicted phage baseplate assembly protein
MRYRPIEPAIGAAEYDGGDGATLRFGDGVFGAIPADGATFEVTYRCGGGAIGNVAAGAIDRFDRAHPIAAQIVAVTNPLAGEGGRDEEAAAKVREMAPQAFRARQYRAVRSGDYEQAAVTLPWVQRAGTAFRWTGSWLTVFTAADPLGSESLPPERAAELTELLNRRRMAGYESYVAPPRYASLDLEVRICARPDAFRGDVKRAVLAALDAAEHPDGTRGFFHPDRFTFGMGLERSAVEAAIQEVPGVDGVLDVVYRRRGHTPGFVSAPDLVTVARDEIVRVDNDPGRPERGSVRVEVVGGK